MRALVLDDDAVHRRLLLDVLNEVGFSACVAHSLEDARSHLDDHGHVFVIADVVLADGFITVSELRHGSTVEVVVISKYWAFEELTAGASRVLRKPYAITELVDLLTETIGTSSTSRGV